MKKLVAIDLDGTLLDDQQRISPLNANAILQLYQQNVVIVLATGRSQASAKAVLQELQVDGYVVCLNGTQISRFQQGKLDVLVRHFLPFATAKTSLDIAKETDVTIHFSTPVKNYRIPQKASKQLVQEFQQQRQDLVELSVDEMQQVLNTSQQFAKIAFSSEKPKLLKQLQMDLKEQGLSAVFSDSNYIELMPVGVNKGSSLQWLTNYLQLQMTDTVAFGDQENDRELLQLAGIGVAMGNAAPDIKKSADFIAKTNNEAGVGQALQALFNL